MVPTLGLKPYGLNVTLTAPTWVTVGPTSYWNRGVSGCGLSVFTPCSTSNAGVFSRLVLTAKMPIDFLIPPRLGNWYISGGFQYYYMINDSLSCWRRPSPARRRSSTRRTVTSLSASRASGLRSSSSGGAGALVIGQAHTSSTISKRPSWPPGVGRFNALPRRARAASARRDDG